MKNKNYIVDIIFITLLVFAVVYFVWRNSYKLDKIYDKMFETNTKDSVYNTTDSTYDLVEVDSVLMDKDDAAQQSWEEYTPVSNATKSR